MKLPDILYSQGTEGEIIAEWDEKALKLSFLTMVDISQVI